MSRLPKPGGDDGTWGDVLNDFLSVAHNVDGTLKNVGASAGVPAASGATAGAIRLAGDLGGTSSNPTVPALATKADDKAVVHLVGTETIQGAKNFTGGATINGVNIVVGSDSRLSDERTPSDGSVTSAKIADGTITDAQIASANIDGTTTTPSLRTLGTGSTQAAAGNDSRITGALQASSNLSDVASAASSRSNLGLGTSATHPAGDFALSDNNLSDLASVSAARTNLGLGDSATKDVGTAAGTVAAGDHNHSGIYATVRDFNVKAAAYGALGDGVTDDRAAIQTALDAALAVGGGTVFLPAGTYLIGRSLIVGSDVTLQGAGRGVTTITKPATVKSLLTANASALATSVMVTDSAGFAVGGPIHLSDTTSYEWLSTQGTITNIAGNVISFTNSEGLGRSGVDGALQTARAATAYSAFPLLRNVLNSTNVAVRGITFDQAKNANDPQPTSASVNGVCDFTLSTIHWVGTTRSIVEDCDLLNAPCDAYSDQAQDGTGVTPSAGIIVTTRNTIRGCKIREAARHAVHLGTCMDGAFVLDNELTNAGWYGVFYCAYATKAIARGNIVAGCGSGFAGIDDRDVDNVIADNNVTGWTGYAIEGASNATRLAITGNVLVDTSTSSGGIYVAGSLNTITGNFLDMGGSGNQGIRLGTSADRCTVAANVVTGGGAGGVHLYMDGADDCRVIGNIFYNGIKGASIRGCARLVAVGNHFSTMTTNTGWDFQVSASTDCVIRDEMDTLTTPWTTSSSGSVVRLVYNDLGDNATSDPASAGNWNAATGVRHNGRLVRWNSGGGEKVSIFNNGVGWTTLN